MQQFLQMAGDKGEVTLEDFRAFQVASFPRGPCSPAYNLDERALAAVIDEQDLDGDGAIQEAEFKKYLSTSKFDMDFEELKFVSASLDACEYLVQRAENDAATDNVTQEKKRRAKEESARVEAGRLAAQEEKLAKDVILRGAREEEAAKIFMESQKTLRQEVEEELLKPLQALLPSNMSKQGEAKQSLKLAGISRSVSADLKSSSMANPILQAGGRNADQYIRSLGGTPAEGFNFSLERVFTPESCDGFCQEWGDDCKKWGERTHRNCLEEVTETHKECFSWGSETSEDCNSWMPSFLGFVCTSWEYTTKTVCTGWEDVTTTTCKTWHDVVETFCELSERVCKAFECMVDWRYIMNTLDPYGHLSLEQSQRPEESSTKLLQGGDSAEYKSSKAVEPLQKAIAWLTGGALYESKALKSTDLCRNLVYSV